MKCKTLVSCFILSCLVSWAQEKTPAAYNNNVKTNYIRVWTATAPTNIPTDLITRPLQDAQMVTRYYDGLGRPLQTVSKEASMATGNSPVDFVSPIHYDALGRETIKYLPFAANNTGGNTAINNGVFKLNPFQQDSVFNKALFPDETFYYSKTIYEASPLERISDTYAPGNSWVGSEANGDPNKRRSVSNLYLLNEVADSVRIWKMNGSIITTSDRYAAGTLFEDVTINEHKQKVVEYIDKEGRTILKKVQLATSPTTGHYGWLCTYYVYDDFGLLRLVIQPKGIEQLQNSSWSLTTTILDDFCFRYEYDARQRMTVKKTPGVAELWQVYDARDRMVMHQDGNMRTSNSWVFTKYDGLNRPIMTGMYKNTTYTTLATMQSYVNGLNLGMSEQTTASFPYYTLNQTFPVIGDTALLTIEWYDNYNWAAGFSGFASKDNSFDAQFVAANNTTWPYPQSLTAKTNRIGRAPTGRWDKTGSGLVTAMYYDENDRVIQTKTRNITGGIDILTTQYSFNGKMLQTVLRHQKSGTNPQTHTLIQKYQYDDLWRLLTIKQSVSSTIGSSLVSSAEQVVANNEYNALGQISKKKLGNKPGASGTPLSNLQYEFNIRGWLTSINKGFLSASNNDQYFSMELGYDKNGAYGTFPAQFNGNISGTIWKNESDKQIRKYDFTYDAANRITAANFNQYVSGSGTNAVLNKTAGLDFSLTAMNYDANGNILALNQKGWKLSGSSHIDSLKYTYYNGGNLLKNVIDAANDTATRQGDFRSSKTYMTALGNSKTNAATDYTYDANGNLLTDRNKDIEDVSNAAIEYNYLNLPIKIKVKNKGTIEYLYDNDGIKISKTVTEGSAIIRTLYIAGFEYKKDTLQQFSHTEGRVRLEQATVNTCPTLPLRFVYDYLLKDHQGNVRMVLTEEQPSDCYPAATVEDARVISEQKIYDIKSPRIIAKATTGATQTSFENKLYRTHGGLTNEKTGLGVVLKVMSGDRVAIRGESFYTLPGGNAGSPLALALTELLTSFVGSSSAALKGVSATTDITGIVGNSTSLTSFVNSNAPGTNTAKAAINWILFDEQFKYVSADFDGVVAGGGYKNHVKFVNAPVSVSSSGYLYIYVSNESNLPVYFDNLQVTHSRGPIVETNDYYPFGLTMAGISSKALNNAYANKQKFNDGSELQNAEFSDGSGLEWLATEFRSYDPQIGRFWQSDALADFDFNFSPYSFAHNNPILINDPLGLFGDTTKSNNNDFFVDPDGNPIVRHYDEVVVTPSNNVESVGQPGFWESLIPVWGSGRAAVDDFQNKRWGSAILNTVLTIADVVTVGVGTTLVKGGIKVAAKEGVYVLTTKAGKKYIGQSGNMVKRILKHFSKGGKLHGEKLKKYLLNEMPGSTKLEREIYEQYLIDRSELRNLVNVVNPMGGRRDLYEQMVEAVLEKFGLPR